MRNPMAMDRRREALEDMLSHSGEGVLVSLIFLVRFLLVEGSWSRW